MPKAKRRIKTAYAGDDPAKSPTPEASPPESRRRSVPPWVNVEAEREIARLDWKYEQIGGYIGVFLNLFVVGPLQIAVIVLRAVWNVLFFTLKHLPNVLWTAWLLFFFGGLFYFILMLTQGN